MTGKQLRANLLLLLAAMIWGAAFVAQSVGADHVGPFTFLCCRSFLGCLVLLPVILLRRKASPQKELEDRKSLLMGGLLCGMALFVASILQQTGLQYTTAGKAGFLTAMYMVLVPISGLFFGKKPGIRVLFAVIIALTGMYLLCFSDGGFSGLNKGDLLEMLCAVCFTAHILFIDRFSGRVDGVKMSCIQFFTCGLLSGMGMLLFETPTLQQLMAAAAPILYAGVLSSGVAFTLQIVAQKDSDPTVASLLMSLESVFSLIFGWIILREAMAGRELLGCVLMFAAIIWVQLPQRTKKDGTG